MAPYDARTAVYAQIDAAIANGPTGTGLDIQALVNAAPAGGTITLPPGTWRIDQQINFQAGKRLIGAGHTQTVLYRNPTTYPGLGGVGLWITGSGVGTELADFAIVGRRGGTGQQADYNYLINGDGTQQFNIHGCYVGAAGACGIQFRALSGPHPTGVIHNCILASNYQPNVVGGTHTGSGYGVGVYGRGVADWQAPPDFGGPNKVFVEDCDFLGNRHDIASNQGAHTVFRFNRVYEPFLESFDMHGGHTSTSPVGARLGECYHNVFNGPGGSVNGVGMSLNVPWGVIRGGSGVAFNNTATGYQRCGLSLWLAGEQIAAYRLSGYPGLYQLQDFWAWGNTITGGGVLGPAWMPDTSDNLELKHWQLERDFYHRRKPGYVPYTYPHPLRGLPPQEVPITDVQRPTAQAYTVQAGVDAATPWGTVTPSGTIQVPVGGEVSTTLTASIDTVTGAVQFIVDGQPVGSPMPLVDGVATLTLPGAVTDWDAIPDEIAVGLDFAAEQTGGGAGEVTVTASPFAGYVLERLMVDGVSVAPLSAWMFNGTRFLQAPVGNWRHWAYQVPGTTRTITAKFKVG